MQPFQLADTWGVPEKGSQASLGNSCCEDSALEQNSIFNKEELIDLDYEGNGTFKS